MEPFHPGPAPGRRGVYRGWTAPGCAGRPGSRASFPACSQSGTRLGAVRSGPVARGRPAGRSPRLFRRPLMARSMLIISRQSPWGGPSAREALDIALAGGAFDLPLGMLFLDDGVFQLTQAQQPSQLQQKDLTANLQALPMFGVDSLYAARRSLEERGLDAAALTLPAEVLDDTALHALINRYDHVITL